jgi:threonine dehydrogenase-like Zn-dependent dehydrogenase
MTGCGKIIGVDRVKSRLDLAKTLGTTGGIDTSSADLNIVEEVNKLTGGEGATIVIDTTGVPALLEAGLQFTASRGKMIFIGVPPPEYALSVHVITHLRVCCFQFQHRHSLRREVMGHR